MINKKMKRRLRFSTTRKASTVLNRIRPIIKNIKLLNMSVCAIKGLNNEMGSALCSKSTLNFVVIADR